MRSSTLPTILPNGETNQWKKINFCECVVMKSCVMLLLAQDIKQIVEVKHFLAHSTKLKRGTESHSGMENRKSFILVSFEGAFYILPGTKIWSCYEHPFPRYTPFHITSFPFYVVLIFGNVWTSIMRRSSLNQLKLEKSLT